MSHTSNGDGKGKPFSAALRQALIAADAKHSTSLDVLRLAICNYVEDLRARGVPTHDITSAIRRRVTTLQSSGSAVATGSLMDGIIDEMVASCLTSES